MADLTAGRIDTHHHVMPEFWRQAAMEHQPGGGLQAPTWNRDRGIEVMEQTGVRASVLSVSSPGVYFGDAARARDLAQRCNDYCAEVARADHDRFGFFATVPLPDVDASLAEVTRAYDQLGADGVILLANTAGQYLGDPALDPLMDELNRRHAVVFVHPNALPGVPVQGLPPFLADFLLDTVRAAINLVLHDVPRRYPNVRMILSHGGGFLPFIPARLDHTFGALGKDPHATEQFHDFYFDTALTPSPSSLPSLIEFAGADHITYGSDFSYAELPTIETFVHNLEAADASVLETINHGTAEGLFPRFASA